MASLVDQKNAGNDKIIHQQKQTLRKIQPEIQPENCNFSYGTRTSQPTFITCNPF